VQDGSLIPRFGRARRDPSMAVLEGFHPLKHALRFGAQPDPVITRDAAQLARLTEALAPDLLERVSALAREVSEEVFAQLAPLPPSTGVIALAARPVTDVAALLAGGPGAPVVLLEDPRDLGNMGACVRVAAAADAAAVLTTGGHDPWHPDALRGAAGLHFALPVARLDALEQLLGAARPLLAIDPDGSAQPRAPPRAPPTPTTPPRPAQTRWTGTRWTGTRWTWARWMRAASLRSAASARV
jgi:TrmH family RNA methyltransferase